MSSTKRATCRLKSKEYDKNENTTHISFIVNMSFFKITKVKHVWSKNTL